MLGDIDYLTSVDAGTMFSEAVAITFSSFRKFRSSAPSVPPRFKRLGVGFIAPFAAAQSAFAPDCLPILTTRFFR